MHSSSPPLRLNISRSVMFMSSSATPSTAKGRGTDAWFIITWIPVTPSPPAIFTSMRRYVLESQRWPVPIKPKTSMLLVRHWKIWKTGQLRRPSNVSPSWEWPTVIASIWQPSLGMFPFHTVPWPTWPWMTEPKSYGGLLRASDLSKL